MRTSVSKKVRSLLIQRRWKSEKKDTSKPLYEDGPRFTPLTVPTDLKKSGIIDSGKVAADLSEAVHSNMTSVFETAARHNKSENGGFKSYTTAMKTLSGFAKGDNQRARSGAWGPAGEGMTDERDEASYMRSKDDKHDVEPPKLDLNEAQKPGGSQQQRARDIALDSNPFGGNSAPVTTFMEYVEGEQDYFKRGLTTEASVNMGRMQARKSAAESAASSRTSEIMSGAGVNTIQSRSRRSNDPEPLTVASWDMNSWTLSNGVRVVGSMILFRDSYYCWDVTSIDDITMEKMMPFAHFHPVPIFIIIGLGTHGGILHPDIHMYMRSRGTRINVMDSQAAIGAYNQNRGDNYPCAAAFLCNEPTNGFDLYTYNQHWKRQRDIASGANTPDSGMA